MSAIDPGMLEQLAAVNGNGGQAPPMVVEDLEVVQQRLLAAIRSMAEAGATQTSAAEAKDYAAAAKAFADAYVVLDPAVDGTGVPLEHQANLERVKQEGALRLEEARAQQAAPAQKRRRLRVLRDNEGRVSGAEEE